ncbi:MAG: flagellar basal body L-ring protein FlgH [bacterium]
MRTKLFFLFIIPVVLFGQDMRPNVSRSLFSDYKATRVGDAITIIVVEASQAANQAELTSGRSSDIGFSTSGAVDESKIPTVDLNIGSSNEFQGGGSSKASGVVKTKISALIDSVYANGLMRIKGSRKISINGEEQKVLISGLVRQADLNASNEVYSYNISEAEIVFEGSGMIDSSTSPGWLTKLFHWLF